jgi:HlyD family secretion protein
LQSINSAKQNLEQSKLNFETKTEAPKSEDITIQKSSLNNSLISLQNAQNNLENTIVRAPFSGTVATVNAKVGEIGNTNIATIIADNKLAKVAFSETDAIKIKNGQKVKMTFDSIENENFEGVVDSVDVLGTVTSGVVTYNVFIKLNSKDIRIKPNMSVNADIVLNEVKDILKVETTAIKTFQEKNFVQKVNEEVAGKNLQDVELVNKPERVNVEIGQNNDEYTEIISGLNEGDIVVVKVNNPTTAKTQTNSLFNMFRPGGNTRATGTSGGAQRQGNFGAPRI